MGINRREDKTSLLPEDSPYEAIGPSKRRMTTLPRRKLFIFGGVFVALLLGALILLFCLRREHGRAKGSDVLKEGPLTSGPLSSAWVKSTYKYSISENSTNITRDLHKLHLINSVLGTIVWSVGASDCSAASQKDAVSQTLEGIDAAVRISSLVPGLKLVSSKDGMKSAKSSNKVGLMIALDGGYTLDSRLALLRTYYSLGARILTLTGNCSTPWADKSGDTAIANGLTDFGKNVVSEASRLGIVVDLAGSSDAAILTVMDISNKSAPILFNGVGAKSLTDNPRNIGDNVISRLKGNPHNLAMVSFKCELIQNKTSNTCTADDVISHINKIAQGSSRSQVGLAVDFGDSKATYPTGLQNMSQVPSLFDKLHTSGWSLDQLKGLAFDNFMTLISNAVAGDLNRKPLDDLEPESELTGKREMTCYSDLDIRYGPIVPPTPPPTQPPTQPTTLPTTPSTTPITVSTTKKQ